MGLCATSTIYSQKAVRDHRSLGVAQVFPGLLLSILLDTEVNLVDSSGKKIAFLREAARITDAKVVLHHGQDRKSMVLPKSDLVTARALAPP